MHVPATRHTVTGARRLDRPAGVRLLTVRGIVGDRAEKSTDHETARACGPGNNTSSGIFIWAQAGALEYVVVVVAAALAAGTVFELGNSRVGDEGHEDV